ncbi:MAG: CADD family putative folate metabolism protein [Patescibacteria group bacterium]
MKHQTFFKQLSEIIEEKSILKHPFYQCWQAGKLEKMELQDYMKQYYHLENAFPRFMSGIHTNCEDAQMRGVMLKDLIGEEGEVTNHVTQLITFSEALGLTENEVVNSKANKNTAEAIDTFLALAQDKNINKGLAALATYKEQIRKVAVTKAQGLKDYYGIQDSKALQFFTTHAKVNTAWHELLDEMISDKEYPTALKAVSSLCDAWWHYLDGVTTPSMAMRMKAC